MSIPVPLDDLPARIATRRATAYLVTVAEGRPHVVTVSPRLGEGGGPVVVGAGRRTAANVAARPEVTLLWPTDLDDPRHSLLVDGTARVTADGRDLAITPTSAVLHRVRAGRGADGGPAA